MPIEHNVARAEAYLHAKFHLDPSNRLATVQQCHRQTDRTGQTDNCLIAQDEPFYKRMPKYVPYIRSSDDNNNILVSCSYEMT